MRFDPAKHHRRSIRLRGYDYRQVGAYFVTVVCADREPLLEDDRFRAIVDDAWLWLGRQYPSVGLDEYVVMPNHIHGIIMIADVVSGSERRGGSRAAPTTSRQPKPLGQLVGASKTVSTKRVNETRGTPGLPVWQRNYYEHVIRDEHDLNRIRQYIEENPLCWEQDPENPTNVGALREAPLRPGDRP